MSGRKFLNTLTAVLFRFLIPERVERLKSRNVRFPALFLDLLDETRPFNAPELHGHKHLPPMTVAELQESAGKLYYVLLLSWIQSARFTEIADANHNLAQGLTTYATYLESTTACVNILHAQMEPACSVDSRTSTTLRRTEAHVCSDKPGGSLHKAGERSRPVGRVQKSSGPTGFCTCRLSDAV